MKQNPKRTEGKTVKSTVPVGGFNTFPSVKNRIRSQKINKDINEN